MQLKSVGCLVLRLCSFWDRGLGVHRALENSGSPENRERAVEQKNSRAEEERVAARAQSPCRVWELGPILVTTHSVADTATIEGEGRRLGVEPCWSSVRLGSHKGWERR